MIRIPKLTPIAGGSTFDIAGSVSLSHYGAHLLTTVSLYPAGPSVHEVISEPSESAAGPVLFPGGPSDVR